MHPCGKGGRLVSDDELYRAYLAGDVSALDTLALRYRERLTAYLAAIVHDLGDALLTVSAVLLLPAVRKSVNA